MDNYTLWTKHGEPWVLMQEGEGDDDDDNNIADWAHLLKRMPLKMNQWATLKKILHKINHSTN